MQTIKDKILVYSDIHYDKADEPVIEKVHQLNRIEKPSLVIQIGDMVTFDRISRFRCDPAKSSSLLTEIRKSREFFRKLRKDNPRSLIYLKEGNHDERLLNYLIDKAPALLELRELTLPAIFELDKSNVRYYTADEPLHIDGLGITHGWHARPKAGYSAHAALEACEWKYGISGHTHKLAKVSRYGRSWIECGHLGVAKQSYLKDATADWQQGFAFGYSLEDSETKEVSWHINPIPVINGSFVVNGKVY